MTKEEIVNAVLNLNVLEIYDVHNIVIYDKQSLGQEQILSVNSKGIIIISDIGYLDYSFTPFEEIAKIVISNIEVIE